MCIRDSISLERSFYPPGHGTPREQQLFAFADASDFAMSGVVYIRTVTSTDEVFVSFVCGFSKVLPKGTTFKGSLSIPRAELCAAVALVEKVEEVERELKEAGEENSICLPTRYFSDSQDVIDWLKNTKDRQKRYVASRIARILKTSKISEWTHIPTAWNPADVGTRPISVPKLRESSWLRGPEFLSLQVVEIPTLPMGKTNMESSPSIPPSPAKFFRKNIRHATEEITMGKMWKREMEKVQSENALPNLRSASLELERR